MRENGDPEPSSFAGGLGALVALITRELGAAAAVILALVVGVDAKIAAHTAREPWPLYLVAGVIFVGVAVVCRWRGRG